MSETALLNIDIFNRIQFALGSRIGIGIRNRVINTIISASTLEVDEKKSVILMEKRV